MGGIERYSHINRKAFEAISEHSGTERLIPGSKLNAEDWVSVPQRYLNEWRETPPSWAKLLPYDRMTWPFPPKTTYPVFW